MADIQKAKGNIQLANHLFEALIMGRFNGQQLRIVLTLLRLTYGWNQHAVRMSEFALAKMAGGAGADANRGGGAFRSAVEDLVENKVIVRCQTEKRGVFAWAINKDFESWERRSSTMSLLVAVWTEKPDHRPEDRRLVRAALEDIWAKDRKKRGLAASKEPDNTPENEWPESGPNERPTSRPDNEEAKNDEWTGPRPHIGPLSGQLGEAKSLNGETYEPSKDMKDSIALVVEKDHLPPPTTTRATETALVGGANSADDGEATQRYAIGMATAANHAITDRWGEQPNPLHYASGLALATELLTVGVSLETARGAVAESCASSKNLRPPFTLGYFREPILRAHRAEEQRALDAKDAGVDRGGPPRHLSLIVDPELGRREERARQEYDQARRAAAIAWGKAADNLPRYHAIVAEVNADYRGLADNEFTTRARYAEIVQRCAKASGFPEFDAWIAERQSAREQAGPDNSPTPGITVPAVEV